MTQQFLWYGLYASAVFVRFPQLLRHLRVLPLGTIRLQALLLSWPALVWGVLWTLLVLIHEMTIGPATAGYRLPLLLACIGSSALAIALGLRLSARWPQASGVGIFLFIPFQGLIQISGVWLIGIGVVSFAAAAVLNVSALSRSATYKRRDVLLPGTQGV